MSALTVVTAIGFFALACWKAYWSVKLLERDPQAWEKHQQVEDEKRRRRQQTLGNATTRAVNLVRGWLGKESDAEPEERQGLHQGNGEARRQDGRRAQRPSGIA